jgi:hypothetical protein
VIASTVRQSRLEQEQEDLLNPFARKTVPVPIAG